MIQIWILNRHVSPIDALQNGENAVICFDCPHKGEGFRKRTCYVNMRYVQCIWRAYRRGRYARISSSQFASLFTGKAIRFGAYGEPVLIPIGIIEALTAVASKWTGYTHQWRKAEYQEYRRYLQASCDSPFDAHDALALGWRYFRVRSEHQSILPGEIVCPASDEWEKLGKKKTTCKACGLCNGFRYNNDPRKNITLLVHGSGAKNFVALTAIARAA
jgi:hypothetical protein